ncbi:MAG: hypothetical protein PHC64_08190 [Candidatus Gastranaerophilales bacterium]|nr:hypothetical protein [Candidatus Gastranaerophilales bacterium]
MKKNGIGGGNTRTGLVFEGKTDLKTLLNAMNDYSVDNNNTVFYKDKKVGYIFVKHDLYKFLKREKIDWSKYISKRLLPDSSIYVLLNNVFYIIECKYQEVGGSVDEKLQTCDFKKKQYKKLLSSLNVEVEYIYILNDWFRKHPYKDVLDYIHSVGCDYYFNYIPLKRLGLPVPEENSKG